MCHRSTDRRTQLISKTSQLLKTLVTLLMVNICYGCSVTDKKDHLMLTVRVFVVPNQGFLYGRDNNFLRSFQQRSFSIVQFALHSVTHARIFFLVSLELMLLFDSICQLSCFYAVQLFYIQVKMYDLFEILDDFFQFLIFYSILKKIQF